MSDGLAIFLGIIIGVALFAIALAITAGIAALTAAIYIVILPFSYLLTVILLLARAPVNASGSWAAWKPEDAGGTAEPDADEIAEPDADETAEPEEAPESEPGEALEPELAAAWRVGPRGFSEPFPRPARRVRTPVLNSRADRSGFFDPPHRNGSPQTVWPGKHVDHVIAEPSYFFGPVMDDLLNVYAGFTERCATCFEIGFNIALTAADDGISYFLVLNVGGTIGLVAGGIAGLAISMVLALLSGVIAALMILAGMLAWLVLRSADKAWRLVRGIKMSCLNCHAAVRPYPIYRCPKCAEPHQDIRPGSRGVAVRNCACGHRFATSLLTGAGNIIAECPSCGSRLPRKFGTVPAIVIPFFGGLNVGKTQLMYTLAYAFHLLVTDSGGTVEYLEDTSSRLRRIEQELAANGHPDKTKPETPRAYALKLNLGLEQRMVLLFDAAGELHYTPGGLRELNYWDKARVLVYVVDPLAVDNLWLKIPEESRKKLLSIRSSSAEGEVAYQQTREQMRRLNCKLKYARLALTVSKADILEDLGMKTAHDTGGNSVREWVLDGQGLDMGNVVREAKHSFAGVEFFRTAALVGDHKMPDDSVVRLAQWLLWCEGIRLRW